MVLNKLKEIRLSKNMSPEELAVKSGVSTMTIRRSEGGKGTFRNNAKAIANALGVKMEKLI